MELIRQVLELFGCTSAQTHWANKKALQQITFINLKCIGFSGICSRIVVYAAAVWETRTIDIANDRWLAAVVASGTAAVILLQT